MRKGKISQLKQTLMRSGQYTSIGGQAVIEGVMMRSPHFITVAVRRSNQKIVLKNSAFSSISTRFPFLKKPLLRGVVTLLESMIQGLDALSFSAHVASIEEGDAGKNEELSNWAIISSLALAFLLGMGLFVALPHFITVVLTSSSLLNLTAKSPFFHLLDGGFKVGILLLYVYLIAMMKDIHRVFQYHGAEHKSIYAFEAGLDLTVENARKFTTLHPRCGTSFLLFLVLISICVFSIVFPLFGLTEISSYAFLNHLWMVFIKIVLMFPVAGLAYEFIKACAFRMDSPVFRLMIWPGMMLQKLTTREPTDDQLEVALASLRQVLIMEKDANPATFSKDQSQLELEISSLTDLRSVTAQVAEFPEV